MTPTEKKGASGVSPSKLELIFGQNTTKSVIVAVLFICVLIIFLIVIIFLFCSDKEIKSENAIVGGLLATLSLIFGYFTGSNTIK